ncbi:MAG: hypothetical protein Roseis2KO_53030 [Roseivirga sp.]
MQSPLKIILSHFNSPDLGKAWHHYFRFEEDVEIIEGDIFQLDCDAIVSPGNSFGFMDGGLDLAISKKMGWGIQTELRKRISELPMKELLIGQAETVKAEKSDQYVICAPTMRVPSGESIPESVNAYLATKAILLECLQNENIRSVAIPGLCTGTGKMLPPVAANQMFMAYSELIKHLIPEFPTFMDARNYQNKMKRASF